METEEFDEVENQRLFDLEEAKILFSNLEKDFAVGSFGYHELLDRTALLQDNWENYVNNHCSCLLHKDLYTKATEISNAIADFYQQIGQKLVETPGEPT